MKSLVFPRAVIAASALMFAAPAFAQSTAAQCDPTANVVHWDELIPAGDVSAMPLLIALT